MFNPPPERKLEIIGADLDLSLFMSQSSDAALHDVTGAEAPASPDLGPVLKFMVVFPEYSSLYRTERVLTPNAIVSFQNRESI